MQHRPLSLRNTMLVGHESRRQQNKRNAYLLIKALPNSLSSNG